MYCPDLHNHLPVGVTVMVATTGFEVVFNPVNEVISPLPFAARPIEGVSLFTQEKVVPGVALVKVIALVAVLAHNT